MLGALAAAAFAALYLGAIQLSSGVQQFLDFGAGVFALVCLSGAVLWGLASTDRFFLYSDHRLITQSVHRVLAVAGLAFLALHIWIKVSENHVAGLAAVLPFTDGAQPVLVGLGTLAGYVFAGVAITGAIRSRFASQSGARLWRLLHMTSYLAWGAALIHGLKSGRAGKDWVTISYVVCLAAVAIVLLLKLRSSSRLPGQAADGPAPVPPPTRPAPPRSSAAPPERGEAPSPLEQPIAPTFVYKRRIP
ncbi:hypothetical protein ACFVSN_43310 [Kitasatospora sp. NPDC057904]|uniref:hypothetical protein n=1 Tax=unclassified Kitasatospora TaxID=2633591 RepID=UPI0036D966E4